MRVRHDYAPVRSSAAHFRISVGSDRADLCRPRRATGRRGSQLKIVGVQREFSAGLRSMSVQA
jgi:hypothetical protein